MNYVNPTSSQNSWKRIHELLAKTTARNCMLYLTGSALTLIALQLWVMIGAKALYDPTATVQFLPFNALAAALYYHWVIFKWLWDQGWLPGGHGSEVFLTFPSALAVCLAFSGAGVIGIARTSFTETRQVRSEKRKDRMRGVSRLMNVIQNVVAGGNIQIAQGSSTNPRKDTDPSDPLWGKLLLGIAVPVCVAAIMMLFGLHL